MASISFISAPASGQGKTSVTAFLARYLRNQGQVVRVFKMGPDYLDPQVLAQASGHPVQQLDLWMAGEAWCAKQLDAAASVADVILVEGAMGLYDGKPSSCEFALKFNLPVILTLDVKGMAQTSAAVAQGLADFNPGLHCVGIIANRCGSIRHRELIQHALPDRLPLLATLPRDEKLALPHRHLGLVQASEITDELEAIIEAGARVLETSELAQLFKDPLKWSQFKKPARSELNQGGSCSEFCDRSPFPNRNEQRFIKVYNEKTRNALPGFSSGYRIGVAKDQAFSFIYQANLDVLTDLGAQLVYFSPLNDAQLPPIDALWLPGGYPELFGNQLQENISMKDSIRFFFQQHKPILAECGGFLYVLDKLVDMHGETYDFLGLLEGVGKMSGKSGCQGLQTANLPEGSVRGHAHHRSRLVSSVPPLSHGIRQNHAAPGEPIFRVRGLTATYLHLFFPANPGAMQLVFEPGCKTPSCGTKAKNSSNRFEPV